VREMTRLTSALRVVIACENMLGLTYRGPLERSRKLQVDKLKAMIAKDPERFSYRHLEAAISLLVSKRKPFFSVAAFEFIMDEVIDKLVEEEMNTDIQRAIYIENNDPREDSERWIGRLLQCSAQYQQDVLRDWRKSRGR